MVHTTVCLISLVISIWFIQTELIPFSSLPLHLRSPCFFVFAFKLQLNVDQLLFFILLFLGLFVPLCNNLY